MLLSYKLGQGSIVLRVKIPDSTRTDNGGVTGLLFSTTGLSISTIADNEASATVYSSGTSTTETITTLGTYAAPTATKCRFKEVDATNHKGVYEIQIADARYAVTSAKSLLITIAFVTASNVAQVDILIPLTSFDPYDVIRAGLTALPAAIPGAAGGLFIAGTNVATAITGGLAITNGTTNGVGLSITGNGTGAGILATGGATGHGGRFVGGATSGHGIGLFGSGGSSNGLYVEGSASSLSGTCTAAKFVGGYAGGGIHAIGNSVGGAGILGEATGGNADGFSGIGFGSGVGFRSSATAVGFGSGGTSVWDEILTAGTHNIDNSAGKLLRLISPYTDVIYTATAPSQAGMTSVQIKLDSGASAVDNTYQYTIISITAGTGVGQSRVISSYVGSTKIATVNAAWVTQPDNTSVFEITPTAYAQVIGTVTVGTNNDKTGYSLTVTPPTSSQIATAIWQDATAGDFTVSSSIGKSLYTAGVVPGASGGLFIAGTNAATIVTTSFTTTFTGDLTGSIGSIATGGITAASIADAAIDRAAFALDTGLQSVRTGTAQAGTTSNITLDAGASAVTDFYRGLIVYLTSNTGAGQVRTIINYNATTKVATIDRPFVTAPTNTTTFVLLPVDNPALNVALAVTANVVQVTIRTGTAQAGSTANTIVLDTGASATNSLYVDDLITIVSGVGAGQSRSIVAYNGTTKVATVNRNWNVTPTNTSVFNILASVTTSTFSDQGQAQAGGATTITLQSTASAVDDLYNGSLVTILSGTGSGQTREITDYVGSTKVATVDSAWSVNPDATSAYAVIPITANEDIPSTPTAAQIATAVWQDIAPTDFTATGSIGKSLYTGGVVPGGTNGLFIAGTNAATIVTTSFTTTFTGNLTGSIGDITATALSKFFITDTTKVYSDAIDGSVVKEITFNAISGGVAAADIAEAVWEDLLVSTDFSTVGSIGKLLKDNINASVSSISPPSAASIVTAIFTDLLSSSDFSTVGSIGKLLKDDINVPLSTLLTSAGYTAPPSAATIATTVWQDLLASSDFSTTASIGKLIKDGTTDPWNISLPGSYASGKAGFILGTYLTSDIAKVSDLPDNFDILTVINNGVNLNLEQVIPVSNTANTLGDCLNAARGQAFGKWVIDRDNKILYIYAPNNSTVIASFDLDSVLIPSIRTPR